MERLCASSFFDPLCIKFLVSWAFLEAYLLFTLSFDGFFKLLSAWEATSTLLFQRMPLRALVLSFPKVLLPPLALLSATASPRLLTSPVFRGRWFENCTLFVLAVIDCDLFLGVAVTYVDEWRPGVLGV